MSQAGFQITRYERNAARHLERLELERVRDDPGYRELQSAYLDSETDQQLWEALAYVAWSAPAVALIVSYRFHPGRGVGR